MIILFWFTWVPRWALAGESPCLFWAYPRGFSCWQPGRRPGRGECRARREFVGGRSRCEPRSSGGRALRNRSLRRLSSGSLSGCKGTGYFCWTCLLWTPQPSSAGISPARSGYRWSSGRRKWSSRGKVHARGHWQSRCRAVLEIASSFASSRQGSLLGCRGSSRCIFSGPTARWCSSCRPLPSCLAISKI